MSDKGLVFIFIILFILIFTGVANLANARELPQELQQYDTDGNGELDETERAAVQSALIAEFRAKYESDSEFAAQMLELLDKDGDGALSDEEIAAGNQRRGGRRGKGRRDISEFDTDGDGVLSDTEKEAAQAAALEKFKERLEQDSEFKEHVVSRFDTDGDGELSDDEISSMMEERQSECPGHGGRGGHGGGRRGGRGRH